MMEALSANEAKTRFGDMLMKVQREPIQINKNGHPVAVVISVEEYESMEILKSNLLKFRALQATKDIQDGRLVDGDDFFSGLLTGSHD